MFSALWACSRVCVPSRLNGLTTLKEKGTTGPVQEHCEAKPLDAIADLKPPFGDKKYKETMIFICLTMHMSVKSATIISNGGC